MEIRVATVTDTFIGMIDGVMKFRIQIFTDEYCSYFEIELSPIGVACLAKILEAVGVKQWEHLRGHHIKIKCDGFDSDVTSICNWSTNEWFDMKEFFEMADKVYAKEK